MNPDDIFPGKEKPKVKVHLQFLGTSNDVHQGNTYHYHKHLTTSKRAKHNYTQTF